MSPHADCPLWFYTILAHLDNTRWLWQSCKSIKGIVPLVQCLTLAWVRLDFTAVANLPLWLLGFNTASEI
jgi:hypothetical protein